MDDCPIDQNPRAKAARSRVQRPRKFNQPASKARSNIAEILAYFLAQSRNQGHADHDDQGQHHGILRCRRPVLGFDESYDILHKLPRQTPAAKILPLPARLSTLFTLLQYSILGLLSAMGGKSFEYDRFSAAFTSEG